MINYHLPGFYLLSYHNTKLLALRNSAPEVFKPNINISTVYGAFPHMTWSGGRMVYGEKDLNQAKKIIEIFNDNGIGLKLTATNPVLRGEHLQDKHSNDIMRLLASNKMNEIIVVSPILEDYIRDKYPNVRISSSTSKGITDKDTLSKELDRYDMVVLSNSLNREYQLLNDIVQKDKVEILVNSYCVDNCKFAKEHYNAVGLATIGEGSKFNCKYNIGTTETQRKRNHYISYDDIVNIYYPLGFTNFKLDGRGFDWNETVVDSYVEYLIIEEEKEGVRDFLKVSVE